MATLVCTDSRFADHDTRGGHPERPERLRAVDEGIAASGIIDDIVRLEPRSATVDEIAAVHDREYLDALSRFCGAGGGHLDADTVVVSASWEVARLAAGAGLAAIDALRDGRGDSAFLAVRPPGHHATPRQAMGFCLVNNVAVAAKALADTGERVLIVDIDAHHGNGTQDATWNDPRIAYVSTHQFPLYPGTGSIRETGGREAPGGTLNLPFPAGTSGDTYRRAVDQVIVPYAERFAPTWLLLSTGFDAHQADPLTGLDLSSGDYADITKRLLNLVPAGRRVVFLEGGYDLDAVRDSTAATLGAMADVDTRPEPATSGHIGGEIVVAAQRIHDL